jgi:hypothetical protein
MSVNLNDLARDLTLVEGKDNSVGIADVKEILAVLGDRWRSMPEEQALEEFRAIIERAGTN